MSVDKKKSVLWMYDDIDTEGFHGNGVTCEIISSVVIIMIGWYVLM